MLPLFCFPSCPFTKAGCIGIDVSHFKGLQKVEGCMKIEIPKYLKKVQVFECRSLTNI